jgi:aspartate carbamoyltransferase regulatory subunit
MSESSQLLVRRIRNGTVIDHIESPRALLVLNILNITGQGGNVITVALNVPSIKHGKKDIIKVENKFLEKKETDKLALIAPNATINIIKNYTLIEKRKIQLPDNIVGYFKCPNLRCITNTEMGLKSKIEIIDKKNMILKCQYCARSITTNELINYQ